MSRSKLDAGVTASLIVDEDLWDVARAAKFLGTSVSWTYLAAESGTLPFSSCSVRRAEVATLRIADFEPEGSTLALVGKGSMEAELLTVPRPLAKRIVDHLSMRGRPPPGAPLLSSCDRAKKESGALTANGLYKRVKWLGRSAGVPRRVTPHGIRHTAVTTGLDKTNGDVRRVGSFARHKKPETTLEYDDKCLDVAGEIAGILAEVAELGSDEEEHGNAHSRAYLSDEQTDTKNRGDR